jgi:hypothetical protein
VEIAALALRSLSVKPWSLKQELYRALTFVHKKDSRKQVSDEVELTPQDEAKRLIENAAEIAKQKEALIAGLRQKRSDIDAALQALGAKRARKASTKKPIGRPKGSKNRPVETAAVA